MFLGFFLLPFGASFYSLSDMKLYPKLIPAIAREIVERLTKDSDVEVEPLRVETPRWTWRPS